MSITSWVIWAVVLFSQNLSFTAVSRARNSNSLKRHARAALASNGIWILSQIIMLGPMFNFLAGKHGLSLQILAGTVYTISTMSGSLVAHYWAKKTEKGDGAVGANSRYAQVSIEDFARVMKVVQSVESLPKLNRNKGAYGNTDRISAS